jgi:hypothetical protein
MGTREDHQLDIQDQHALFLRVVALLEAKRAADPTIMEVARLPCATLWAWKDHLLFFEQGSGHKIGFGQIRHGDSPRRFQELAIVRSKQSPSLFQLNQGPERDLEVIAIDVVESFLGEAAAPS